MATEARTIEPIAPVTSSLRCDISGPFQQAAARQTEVGGHAASDHLGLVEPPLASPMGARGRPRDNVDVVGAAGEAAGEDSGDVGAHRPPVLILEPEQYVAHSTGV